MSPKSPISYPWHITIDDCTPSVLPCVLIERSVSQHNLILDVRFAARYWRQHPHLRDTCPQTLRTLVHGYFLAQALHLDNCVLSSFDAVESSMHLAFFFFSLHLVFSLKVMMSLRHGAFSTNWHELVGRVKFSLAQQKTKEALYEGEKKELSILSEGPDRLGSSDSRPSGRGAEDRSEIPALYYSAALRRKADGMRWTMGYLVNSSRLKANILCD